MRPIFWTPERVKTMRDMAEEGKPARVVAEKFGVSTSAVEWQASQYQISFRGHSKTWTRAEDEIIISMAAEGHGWKEVSRALGDRTHLAVKSRAQKLGAKYIGKGAHKEVKPPPNAPKMRPRKCLMHGGEFTPEHRHEFVCASCKATRAWRESQVQLI